MQITQPTLIKAASNWYIEYYDLDESGKKIKRHQQKCGLTRIKDTSEREVAAAKAINRIRAAHGLKTTMIVENSKKGIAQSLREIATIMIASYTSEGTQRTIRQTVNPFITFLEAKNLDTLRCADVRPAHVQSYFDYLKIEYKTPCGKNKGNKVSNRTINNHRKNLIWLINEMKEREYLKENPCQVKPLKNGQCVNRPFTEQEKNAVCTEIFATDNQLTFAVLMIHRLAIRSYFELSNLKPSYFNFEKGILKIPGEVSKTKLDDQFVTIPDEISDWLISFLKDIPQNWFILGSGPGLKPNPTERMGKNAMYHRHKMVLEKLKKQGKLQDITGLSIYQWKHTGAFELIDKGVDIHTLRLHLRHADINTTANYINTRLQVQQKIKDFSNGLVPTTIIVKDEKVKVRRLRSVSK